MKYTAVIDSKGQIVIPRALRKRHGLHEGDTVVFQEKDGRLILESSKYAALYALRGSLGHLPLEEDLQKERAAEREREDQKLADIDPFVALSGTWTFGDADEFVRKLREDE